MTSFIGYRGPCVLFVIFLIRCFVTVQGQESSSSIPSSNAGPPSNLPCHYKGEIIFHGDVQRLDECSSCYCDNSTFACQFESCPPLTCNRSIEIEGICCKSCPYTPVNDTGPPSDLPCVNNEGGIVLHGGEYRMTECSSCYCDNSTFTCQFESCPPLTCNRSIEIEGICCKICPYNVTVNDVIPIVPPNTVITMGEENEITLDLDVMYAFNSEATGVSGQGLWTTRLWMAQYEDGTGELSGTIVDEALTEEQQSQRLKRSPGRTFSIEDIRYRFDLTDHTCNEAKFICAKFNKGPYPEVERDYLTFHFDAKPTEEVLTGCVEIIFCNGFIRLAGGSDTLRGRVEIYHNDAWGAICDRNWDLQDANTVCRQLGFKNAVEATRGSFFGATELPTLMDRVACKGTEPHLFDCAFVCSRFHWCNGTAGVVCKPDNIRLVGGANHTMGRVELLIKNAIWGSICDDDWDMKDAEVVCRQLGFSGAKEATSGSYFGPGNGHYVMQGVRCDGSEAQITDCPSHCWDEPKCNSAETAGVICLEGLEY